MSSHCLTVSIGLLALPISLCAADAPKPRFTAEDAIRAEWRREIPAFSELDLARMSKKDRGRLNAALQRMAAPQAPGLLPPELSEPSLLLWESKVLSAKTPEDRFTALHFLNRLKSKVALKALDGLTSRDAKKWPRHMQLSNAIATARINGCALTAEHLGFVEALKAQRRVEPFREQAAQLRLVHANLEKAFLEPVPATDASLQIILSAWNKGPWEVRSEAHTLALKSVSQNKAEEFPWQVFGLLPLSKDAFEGHFWLLSVSLLNGLPPGYRNPEQEDACQRILMRMNPDAPNFAPRGLAVLDALPDFKNPLALAMARKAKKSQDLRLQGHVFPILREMMPSDADEVRQDLLFGKDPIGRANAIADLEGMPADMENLMACLWKPSEDEGVQSLLLAFVRWELKPDVHMGFLKRLMEHPSWTARRDAYTHLLRLDAKAPWPKMPELSADEGEIEKEAIKLVKTKKAMRIRIHFEGKKSITLKLNPQKSPLNVANFLHLTRKAFFDHRQVARVVPDFVVQMGSPRDTMDGGPGYTVRCENSLDFYGPGSVGMALSTMDSGGSQFFITLNVAPHLTGRYTRVGEVENLDEAMPILDSLKVGSLIEKVEIVR